jgi:rhamnose utilization protein RhaD (predicted bifunctional aldolase and dehydrogenase)/NAD(P)-dependent dehydrogenase (short-subunit alcohol dehydrogenase family)
MKNRWEESELQNCIAEWAPVFGPDLAARTYSSRLLGSDPRLVLHGGGNTSVKSLWVDRFGSPADVIYVKASGFDMASIPPSGHSGLLLDPLRRLLAVPALSDQEMVDELRRHLLDWRAATPSIETLLHAAVPARFVDHTHADALLTLTNQIDPDQLVGQVLGPRVAVITYVRAGFDLARAVQQALAASPGCDSLVLVQHGLVTWADTAGDSYSRMIELVTRAEEYLEKSRSRVFVSPAENVDEAWRRYRLVAPIIRGCLALPSGELDRPFDRSILRPLISSTVLGLLESEEGRRAVLTPPLTPDHLIRTKALPLFFEYPDYNDLGNLPSQLRAAVDSYAGEYQAYFGRNQARLAPGLRTFDPLPRVIMMPGIGAVCAGENVRAAEIARDITAQTLAVKGWFASSGTRYVGLNEAHVFDMEYFPLQHAKLKSGAARPRLGREVALVTGAAGAIGLGICEKLLEEGCHVAVTDLPGEGLDLASNDLQSRHPGRVMSVPLDVTDPGSVSAGFQAVSGNWGGVDIVIVNAGIAHVCSLADMTLDAFRRLEKVNVEGTLLVLSESARHFRLQATGGDIILVSTKNVFAPGARFGAYSATKAAAHQLARIASLELAELGVRVNMVAPDAVFSHGPRKSGLWAEVGPDRMKARGLDEQGLEEYYRSRNLLKARVTAEHVGRAVLYFATRQSPTTGATIPVDGGLPDATPR